MLSLLRNLGFFYVKNQCFIVGKECGFGGLPDMCNSSQSMAWVNECCYLGVVVVSG